MSIEGVAVSLIIILSVGLLLLFGVPFLRKHNVNLREEASGMMRIVTKNLRFLIRRATVATAIIFFIFMVVLIPNKAYFIVFTAIFTGVLYLVFSKLIPLHYILSVNWNKNEIAVYQISGARLHEYDVLDEDGKPTTLDYRLHGKNSDVIIIDPPRCGVDKRVIEEIYRLRPFRIISVSCDPSTFARDSGRLIERGYKLIEVQPLDMFPCTSHVELIGLLERN